jgi:hypothetical protein
LELADEHFADEQRKGEMGYTGSIKNCLVALAGVGFFFGIIGVFGLSVSLASLATFIAVAVWIFNSKQLPDAGQ